MIDPFIIEYIRKRHEESKRKKEGERRIPLYINPPEHDGYSEEPKDENNRGYIEIDLNEDCRNILEI